MKKWIRIVCVVLVGVGIIGCSDHDTTQTFATIVQVTTEDTQLVLLRSDERHYDEKEKDVAPRLLSFINSGRNNIVSIKTVYTSGYLTSAEIYVIDGTGPGNMVRLTLVRSIRYYFKDKEEDVLPAYQIEIQKHSGTFVTSNTVYESTYLVAAEVFYIVQ